MSETPGAPEAAPDTSAAPELSVILQYVKDLSFENPNAPNAFRHQGEQADMDVNVDIQARSLAENQFEVEMRIRATARRESDPVFMVELLYAGVFGMKNVPPDQVEPVLLIECPRMLFPFARRIVGDAVRDGGFPPLMIDPIDFFALYQRRKAAGASQPNGAAGA